MTPIRDGLQAAYLGRMRSRPGAYLGDVGEIDFGHRSTFDRAMPADYPIRAKPRKWWEWEYIAACAEALGALRRTTTALGLGVGDEPLMYYFANSCGRVIATDLYSGDTAWTEARFADLAHVYESSPIRFDRDRLEMRNADMRATGVPASSVDLVWSCSSIEHVPTLEDLVAVFREIHRVLRVGGHAILTTEFCISGNNYLLPGVNAWNSALYSCLAEGLAGFRFLGPIDLSFNALHPGNGARPRRYEPISGLPQASSLLSFNRRAGTMGIPAGVSVVVPIAFVIEKISDASVLPYEQLPLPAMVRTYTDGVVALNAGNYADAVQHLNRALEAAGTEGDLQMQLLALRFEIDARARQGEMTDRSRFLAHLDRFSVLIPPGPVQDDDCLDFVGYLYGELGMLEQCLLNYERCLCSPSATRSRLFALAPRYWLAAAKAGCAPMAEDRLTSLLKDLRQFGISLNELDASLFEGTLRDPMLPASLAQRLREAVVTASYVGGSA